MTRWPAQTRPKGEHRVRSYLRAPFPEDQPLLMVCSKTWPASEFTGGAPCVGPHRYPASQTALSTYPRRLADLYANGPDNSQSPCPAFVRSGPAQGLWRDSVETFGQASIKEHRGFLRLEYAFKQHITQAQIDADPNRGNPMSKTLRTTFVPAPRSSKRARGLAPWMGWQIRSPGP